MARRVTDKRSSKGRKFHFYDIKALLYKLGTAFCFVNKIIGSILIRANNNTVLSEHNLRIYTAYIVHRVYLHGLSFG